ncbi:MAG: glycine dehydrogenase (aminomethyl-transferring), partial [Salinibacterium sp.]|nr:glycine dehydrogenase (aminomethyl-transferring) [Salinibacterium sp.]
MATSSGAELGEFAQRHIGTHSDAQSTMLDVLGYESLPALVSAAVPDSIKLTEEESVLPPAATEREALAELRAYASRNRVNRAMIGLGYYDTVTPAVLRRNIVENPAWYTAYTP